jgi:hypothetical protein
MPPPIKWKQLVADALQALGGEASLKEITATLKDNPLRPKTATWNATIRRVVRQYKIFEPTKIGNSAAGYRLVKAPELKLPKSEGTDDPHGEQQGMLLQLGKFCAYETFTNSTDKTIRQFHGEPISRFATIRNDEGALSALPLPKIRTADVIWMAEDDEGLYPRYAFEIENSTKVRSGLLRLLKIPERFHTRLFIIGSGDEEEKLFARYLNESPFRQHAHRFQFYRYNDVEAFYDCGLEFQNHIKGWRIFCGGLPVSCDPLCQRFSRLGAAGRRRDFAR